MSFELIIGPMFAGKSTDVIRRTERYQLAGKRCLLIKHTDDKRWDAKTIQTHRGDQAHANIVCIVLDKLADADISDYDVIAVDELQMFEDALLIDQWSNNGKIVIGAGLDADVEKKPMGQMPEVISIADKVHKLLAVCKCGMDAPFTRTLPGVVMPKNNVKIGGKELYIAVCRQCWLL